VLGVYPIGAEHFFARPPVLHRLFLFPGLWRVVSMSRI
jgi:hypothetical protein